VEEPTITKSKKGSAISVFNREHPRCFFLNVKGIVHHEFVPPYTVVNSDIYCDVLRCLREKCATNRPELWRNHNWLLHHENAPAHMPLKTAGFVTNNNKFIVLHSPYSLDLAHCYFALSHKFKLKLK
jgi:hypothetical protein